MEDDRVSFAVDRYGGYLAKLVAHHGPVIDNARLRWAVQMGSVDWLHWL